MKLIERVSFDDGAEFIEEDGHKVVKNVAMLGPISTHGYEYEQSAMSGAVARGLYEGCRIFINHKEAQTGRDVMELAGVFRQTRHEGGKIRGDAHLLPDEYGTKFFNIAKHMPEAASCSHVADGRLVRKNGKQYVEQIDKVHSVDLVVAGATTSSVFEGQVIEGDIPKPDPKERQFEFISRCIATVKAGNKTLADEEAGAICFASWQSRFEGGMEDNPITIPSSKPAVKKEVETVSDNQSEERNNDMSLDTMLDEQEVLFKQAVRILTLSPAAEEIIRTEQRAQDDRAYAERQAAHRDDAQLVAEAAAILCSGQRESDGEFARRMEEEDRARHPLEYLSESQVRELTSILLVD